MNDYIYIYIEIKFLINLQIHKITDKITLKNKQICFEPQLIIILNTSNRKK